MSIYLEHHGIKGQKWGIRNGPPYPLEKHKNISYGGKSNYIDTFKKKSNDSSFNKSNWAAIHSDMKEVNKSDDHVLSCGYCAVTYDLRRRGYNVSVYNKQDIGVYSKDIVKLYKDVEGHHPVAEWMDDSFKDKKAETFDYFTSANGSKLSRFKNPETFESYFNKYPEGSRGLISFAWFASAYKTGTFKGHYINWEIIDGRVQFIDSQNNIVMTDGMHNTLWNNVVANSIQVFRTDDLEYTDAFEEFAKKGGIR